MFSRSHLRVLSVLAVIFAIAQAQWFGANILRRQETTNGGLIGDPVSSISSELTPSSPTESIESSATEPTSSPSIESSSSPPPTSTPAETTSSPPSTSETSSLSPSVSSTPEVTTPPSTSQEESTPTPTPTPSSSDDENASTTTEKPVTTAFPTVIVITTVVDGSSKVYSTTSSVSTTSRPTGEASLNSGDSSKSSGMSSKTRNTVIGVVVGIGGAIILAGLFVVAWRIWGRKKTADDDDGLMGFRGGSAGNEKNSSVGGNTPTTNPFQSTLDQYHNPNRQVNASSNF